MSSTPFTVIVTGANRGIGHATCVSILSHPTLSDRPLTLHATSRSGTPFDIPTKPHQSVHFHSLDISSQDSIAAFASHISKGGGQAVVVDVLINNAGVNLDEEPSVDNAKKTLETNYRGTLSLCHALLPHMRQGTGRIVSLSSTASSLSLYSSSIANRFRSASSFSDIDALAAEYLSSFQADTLKSDGWPVNKSYSVSKACVNAMTAILSKQKDTREKGVVVNCCCPGWVNTEMGKQVGSRPSKTPEEGAKIPVKLALGDIGGVSGRYWGNDSISDKGEGKVQEW